MKFALIALFSVANAAKISQKESPDCPESTQVFSFNERAPSNAGLVQTSESPDCPESTQVFSYNERAPAAAGLTQKKWNEWKLFKFLNSKLFKINRNK